MESKDQLKKSLRGFAAMNEQKQREIARKGGKAAHQQGVAHQWNSEEARKAGRKGGQSRRNHGSSGEMPG
jgi:general stress protein YciG